MCKRELLPKVPPMPKLNKLKLKLGVTTKVKRTTTFCAQPKPSHIEFGKSTVKAHDLVVMKKLGYFGENEDGLIRFAR